MHPESSNLSLHVLDMLVEIAVSPTNYLKF